MKQISEIEPLGSTPRPYRIVTSETRISLMLVSRAALAPTLGMCTHWFQYQLPPKLEPFSNTFTSRRSLRSFAFIASAIPAMPAGYVSRESGGQDTQNTPAPIPMMLFRVGENAGLWAADISVWRASSDPFQNLPLINCVAAVVRLRPRAIKQLGRDGAVDATHGRRVSRG